jgi:hypothetical protein
VIGNGPGATGIGLGTATLNAELLAGGLADVTIFWGRSDGSTNATAWESSVPLGDLWTGFPDAETVNGVLYGIPYYYRAFASNAYGSAWADASALFKTAYGTFSATRGLTARVYEGMNGVNTNLEPISNAFALAATETNLWQDAALNYPNAGAIRAAFPALIDNDHMMLTWEGYIDTRIEGPGTYSFGTSSDDGSVVYIDLNHDGDFSDGFTPNTGNVSNPGGELIVDNNWNHPALIQTGNVVLDAYGCYRIAFGFYEAGGGESILVKYAKGADVPFAEMAFIDGSESSTQPFFPSCPPSLYAIYNDNPTGVTTTEATLNGILDASNAVYSAILYWGDEDGGMDTNGWDHAVPVGAFTNIAGISQLVALPSTGTYYYTWRATNCLDDLWAPDTFSFGTPTVPTIDNLAGASDIGIHAATVNGALSAGGSAEITLYYGPSDGGTNPASWAFSSNLGIFGEGPLSASRDDFWYGVRWYYRMHASNPVGDDWADSTADFKTLTPAFAGTPGLLAHQYDTLSGQTWINPISNLQAQTPSGTSTQSDPLNYDTRAGGTPFANPFVNTFPYITAGGTFAILWEGWFIPPNGAGTYTFGVEHDDRSMLALDLDGDGDFDDGTSYDAGELVVDANTTSGGCCGQQLGSVVLEDRPYRFATALEQGGGDRFIIIRWGFGTYATFAAIPNLADGSSGPFALVPSIEAWSLSGDPATAITMTAGTLNGSLNTSGTVFDVSVHWGSSDGGTSTISWASSASLGSYSNGAFALDHDLSGLTAGATYYYSFRATNCTEEIWADTGYFSTVFDVAGFTEQLKITFCGYNKPETLIDFPAMLVLSTNIPGFDYSAFVTTDGGDLRFTDQAGALIDHEIETWGGSTDSDSVIWVEIPQLVDSTTYIFANWGNPGVTNLPPYASDGSTWADGLGVWHFADMNATDSSGNGWDGTGNGVTPTPGIANGALDFPGTVHAGPGLSFANQSFTVSAWARKEVNGQDGWLVSHGISQNNKGLHFGFRAVNSQFSFAFWGNDLNLPGFTDTSTWHYWTGVYDATASDQRLYRDGVLAGSRIAAAYQGDPGTLLRIGERFGNQQFIGEIDEVRLLGSAMSSNRVAATYLNIASNSTFVCFGGPGPGDTDGDGMSDADEAIAGTDPLDPDSVLAVVIFRGGNETTRTLSFPSVIGRTYDIHWRSELLSGTWIPLALSVAGTGSDVSIDHISSEQTVYYRIEVNN